MRVVQAFGANPEAYAQFGLQGHNGLDFEAEEGDLVVAVDDGEVVEVRFDGPGYGVTVKLLHAWGESRYAHGQRYSVPIDFVLGHIVRRGERVFLAGSTGVASAAHLHFGLRLCREDGSLGCSAGNGFGGWQDPLPYLREALELPAVEGVVAKGAGAAGGKLPHP
ncbi:MAG TPA: M23 family metallopeptidase, partial [Chloroflexota bacterium]